MDNPVLYINYCNVVKITLIIKYLNRKKEKYFFLVENV